MRSNNFACGWTSSDRCSSLDASSPRDSPRAMPQLEEDEWPKPSQPTTTEAQQSAESKDTAPEAVRSDYPPQLPPEALPTKD